MGCAGLETVHAWYDKVAVPRRDPADRPTTVERLDAGAGLQAAVADAFLPEPVHGLGPAQDRFPKLIRLLHEVPIAELRYPMGFD